MARGDQLARQWKIIQTLITSRQGKSAAELAGEFECHPRTLYRDLEALQAAGFPIYTERVEGKNLWSLLDTLKHHIPIPFSLTELMALYFSTDMLKAFKGTAFHDFLESLSVSGQWPDLQGICRQRKKTEAIGFLQQRIAEIRTEGKSHRDLENVTLGELMGDYLLYFDQRGKRDKERVFTVFGHFARLQAPELSEVLGKMKKGEVTADQLSCTGRKAAAISDGQIESYKTVREKEGASHSTINRELDVIRRIFKLGVERRKVHPFRVPLFERYAPSDPRRGFIGRQELQKLLQHLPDWLQPVVEFSFHTAWRKREVTGLMWEHVDLENRTILLPSRLSKNGKARPIYIDDEICRILMSQKKRQLGDGVRSFPFVFHRMRSFGSNRKNLRPLPIGDFRKVWSEACKKIGLDSLLLHDLRRSGIREIVRSGYSEQTAMEVSGHRTNETFRRYNIQDLEDQKRAAERRKHFFENGYN
jgi:integrase